MQLIDAISLVISDVSVMMPSPEFQDEKVCCCFLQCSFICLPMQKACHISACYVSVNSTITLDVLYEELPFLVREQWPHSCNECED
jgi:hypothetical protein